MDAACVANLENFILLEFSYPSAPRQVYQINFPMIKFYQEASLMSRACVGFPDEIFIARIFN